MIPCLLVAAGLFIYFHRRMKKVPPPPVKWDLFLQPNARPLSLAALQKLQGIYEVVEGADSFGEKVVVKWSYTVEREEVQHHISFFCGREGSYFITGAKSLGHRILLCGNWRKVNRATAGSVQLTIGRREGAGDLLQNSHPGELMIRGFFGESEETPDRPLAFRYLAPLEKKPFDVIAHRGGSRNVDFLPVSENSLDMLKLAAPLGATGVEIDVRLTADGVPVLFHDSFLSGHSIQDTVYAGRVHKQSLEALQERTLKKGGKMPTLKAALDTILYQTPLRTVWLDIKFKGDLQLIRQMQRHYQAEAARMQRDLQIYIGVPDESVLKAFRQLDNYTEIPSIVELDPAVVEELHADIWAPQYIEGVEAGMVARMHAGGRKAFVWSLDDPALIHEYMTEGGFDGIVTNIPSVVAFQYYTGAGSLQPAPANGHP